MKAESKIIKFVSTQLVDNYFKFTKLIQIISCTFNNILIFIFNTEEEWTKLIEIEAVCMSVMNTTFYIILKYLFSKSILLLNN